MTIQSARDLDSKPECVEEGSRAEDGIGLGVTPGDIGQGIWRIRHDVDQRFGCRLSEPTLGGTWTTTLDCSAHASGLALLLGSVRPLSGVFLPQGEVLIDTSAGRLFQSVLPHAGGAATLQEPVPNDIHLVNLQLFVQGLSTGAPGARLSNALDVVVGY